MKMLKYALELCHTVCKNSPKGYKSLKDPKEVKALVELFFWYLGGK